MSERRVPRYPPEMLSAIAGAASVFQRYPLPWRAAEHHRRVYVMAANGRRVCEVEPGQLQGELATHEGALALAEAICCA